MRDVVAGFERSYRQQYGFLMPGKPLVIEAVAVEAVGRAHDAVETIRSFPPRSGAPAPERTKRIYTGGASTMPPSTTATGCGPATRSPASR